MAIEVKAVYKNRGNKEIFLLGGFIGGEKITKMLYVENHIGGYVKIYIGNILDRVVYSPDMVVFLNEGE